MERDVKELVDLQTELHDLQVKWDKYENHKDEELKSEEWKENKKLTAELLIKTKESINLTTELLVETMKSIK